MANLLEFHFIIDGQAVSVLSTFVRIPSSKL